MVANQRSNTVNRSTKSVGKDISALSSRKPFLAKKQTLELVSYKKYENAVQGRKTRARR